MSREFPETLIAFMIIIFSGKSIFEKKGDMENKNREKIKKFTFAAGAIGVPGTFSLTIDALSITTIWVAMILSIASEADQPVNEDYAKKIATGVLSGIGMYLSGSKMAAQLIQLIPGPGQLAAIGINSGLNALFTYKLGCELIKLFDHEGFGQYEEDYVVKNLTSLVTSFSSKDEIKELIAMINQNEFLKNEGGKNADQLFEEVQREAGIKAIEKVVNSQLTDITAIRDRFPIEDLDLLSTRVSNLRTVPQDIRQRVSTFQNRVRMIIEKVATSIEERKSQKTENEIFQMKLSASEKQRVSTLMTHEKRLFISYESLKSTVELLSQMNDQILQGILESEKNKDASTERRLILGNAILVYELTDYVISYIENFHLSGINEIMGIHQNEIQKLQGMQVKIEALKKQSETASSQEFRNATLEALQSLEHSCQVIKDEWKQYIDQINQIQKQIQSTGSIVNDLRLLRNTASVQIEFISSATTLGILKKNFLALKDTMRSMESFRLASLTPERVKRLFLISGE